MTTLLSRVRVSPLALALLTLGISLYPPMRLARAHVPRRIPRTLARHRF
jgi:hypothetical protein